MNKDYSNKYYKIKGVDFYFKTGKCCLDDNYAAMNFEILDYSGSTRYITDYIRMNNIIYTKYSYAFLENLEEIESDIFYTDLADRIVRFIIKLNFNKNLEMMQLDFNATEDRRALYRKIKVPLIIKETI